MKGILFTYALTYGGALAGLMRPYVGFLVYVALSILRPESLWFWSVPSGNYSLIVALPFLIGWAAHGFGRWDFGGARPIALTLAGFWACLLLSAFVSPEPTLAWRPGGTVDILSKTFLPWFVGLSLIESTAQLKQLAWTIFGSMSYVALEFNQQYLSGWNRLLLYGFGGMDNNCNAIALVTCVGLAFFLGLHAEGLPRRLLALASSALIVHAVLFSFSRGGMIALAFTGLVAFWLIPKRPVHYATFALGVAATIFMAGDEVRAEFLTIFAGDEERDESSESRIVMWKGCIACMGEHPAFGVGPERWRIYTHIYTGIEGYRGKQAHTLWLQLGAELGVPALVLLLACFTACVAGLWPIARYRRAVSDPWQIYLSQMVVASLAGFVVSAQFVSIIRLELPYYIILIGAGVLKLRSRDLAAGLLPRGSGPIGAFR